MNLSLAPVNQDFPVISPNNYLNSMIIDQSDTGNSLANVQYITYMLLVEMLSLTFASKY